jgi:anti-sigma regulatory factor (Ser/Thr protein kinase)
MAEESSVDIELNPEPEAPAEARAALDALRPALPAETHDDLRLVVSELVTNSVLHGPGSPIRLRLVIEDNGNVRGEIEDEGDGSFDRGRTVIPINGDGGYGLHIVDALTQRWGVYEGSSHVWFEIAG